MARRRREEHAEPLNRLRAVNPAGPLYDVKSGGHTVEWTASLDAAIAAYSMARKADRQILRLVNGVKVPITVTNGAVA